MGMGHGLLGRFGVSGLGFVASSVFFCGKTSLTLRARSELGSYSEIMGAGEWDDGATILGAPQGVRLRRSQRQFVVASRGRFVCMERDRAVIVVIDMSKQKLYRIGVRRGIIYFNSDFKFRMMH